jgi:amino acid permease
MASYTLDHFFEAYRYLGLSVSKPPQAPALFAWTTARGVPLPALLLTSSVSALCFGSSFIGSGQVHIHLSIFFSSSITLSSPQLWGWLQNIVGVSNQVGYKPKF